MKRLIGGVALLCVLVASSLLLSCDPGQAPGVRRLIEESDRRLTEQAERVIEKDPVLREMAGRSFLLQTLVWPIESWRNSYYA